MTEDKQPNVAAGGRLERIVSTMPQVTIAFPNEDARDDFLAWLSDGGGEYQFMENGQIENPKPVNQFNYSRAFECWGYDEKEHGEPLVICEC